MKLLKNKIVRIFASILVIGIIAIGVYLLFPKDKVGASDTVDMLMFNELKAKVEALETQLQTANDKIVELTNADVTINQNMASNTSEIGKIKTDLTAVTGKVNTNTTNITNITNKVIKTEAWQNKLFELKTSTQNWNDTYVWLKMKEFVNAQ